MEDKHIFLFKQSKCKTALLRYANGFEEGGIGSPI